MVLKDVLSAVQEKKQQCLQKRWKYENEKSEAVILRDVFDKIMLRIDKFKAVGDVVVLYDITHAALPWAAVRLVLQVWGFQKSLSINSLMNILIRHR